MKRTMILAAVAMAAVSPAAVISGGTDILTQAHADQLENWLGEGPVVLTRVFSKKAGDGKTSADFHAAADNKGRTFSVWTADSYAGSRSNTILGPNYSGTSITNPSIVGGYNPFSWSTTGNGAYPSEPQYNYFSGNAERTAFLFNLTAGQIGRQEIGTFFGGHQTYNWVGVGPAFGAGATLWVDGSLEMGIFDLYSLGYSLPPAAHLTGGTVLWNRYTQHAVGKLEVFTIAPVPEPGTMAALALGSLALLRRRRRA